MRLILNRFLGLIKNHTYAILFAFIVAILVVSPHLRAWSIVGEDAYTGVHPAFNDDEIYYQARIKEASEGNWGIGNPYLKEHKDDPFLMPPVAEWLIAGIVRVTGAPVPLVTSASDAVLGFVNFILLYTLFLALTQRSKRISLLYTTIFFCLWLSTFGRPVSPQLNTVFLFLGMIAVTKLYFLEGAPKKILNLVTGLVTGVTCFISPYYFTALLTLYFALLSFQSLSERSLESPKKNVPWFLVGFLPFAFLWGFFQMQAAQGSFYSEGMIRFGLIHTHIPGSYTNMMFGGLALGVLILGYRFLSRPNLLYGGSLIMSIFILNWQNILTGKSLQFSSHYLFVTILFALIVMAIIQRGVFVTFRDIWKDGRKLLVMIVMVVVFAVMANNQKAEFLNIAKMPYTQGDLIKEQKKMEVFDWFNENTEADSVVYVLGGNYDFLVPIYTENRVYYNFYATIFPISDRETEERWIIQQLFDQSVGTTTIRERQREFWGNKYIDSYQSGENRKKIIAKLTGKPYVPGEFIPEAQVEYMYSRWLDIQAQPINESLNRYEIDYILLSRDYPYWETAKARLDTMEEVVPVVTLGKDWVYALKDPG